MGTVGITLKVMPTSPEVDLEDLKEQIEATIGERAKLQQITNKPIAFGLVALMVQVTMEEGTGDPDDLEAVLEALEPVESVTVEAVGLL